MQTVLVLEEIIRPVLPLGLVVGMLVEEVVVLAVLAQVVVDNRITTF